MFFRHINVYSVYMLHMSPCNKISNKVTVLYFLIFNVSESTHLRGPHITTYFVLEAILKFI